VLRPQVHIGSVHPERDFERWLNERRTGGGDVVAPAIEPLVLTMGTHLGLHMLSNIQLLYSLGKRPMSSLQSGNEVAVI
jgi:hypothetical protein